MIKLIFDLLFALALFIFYILLFIIVNTPINDYYNLVIKQKNLWMSNIDWSFIIEDIKKSKTNDIILIKVENSIAKIIKKNIILNIAVFQISDIYEDTFKNGIFTLRTIDKGDKIDFNGPKIIKWIDSKKYKDYIKQF